MVAGDPEAGPETSEEPHNDYLGKGVQVRVGKLV